MLTSRCDLCPSRTTDGHEPFDCTPVAPTGPGEYEYGVGSYPGRPCDILFLGAGPGKVEATTHRAYTGLAGDELTGLYLPLAGLSRETAVVGNATRCWDGTDRTPPESRVLACARHHLPDLLRRVKPRVVVTMGGVTQAVVDMRVRLDMHHGIPQRTSLLNGTWEGWVVPMFEPALGMRETTRMTAIMDDFRRLGAWMAGEWTAPTSSASGEPSVKKDYALVESVSDLLDYLNVERPFSAPFFQPAVDTESHGPAPWSVQFSRAAHTGRLVRADNTAVLRVLAEWMREQTITLHNANQDLDTLAAMNLVPVGFSDTMQEAFQLCYLPQGLKPLAYRLLGVTMRSWEDVVWPASVMAVTSWMEQACAFAAETLSEQVEHRLVRGRCVDCSHQHTTGPCKHKDKVTGERCTCTSTRVTFVWYEQKPGAVESVLRHIVKHTAAGMDKEKPYHPWKTLSKMKTAGLRGKVPEAWEWEAVEEVVGRRMPILGIGNTELAAAVDYGCSDADHTGQVAEVLRELRKDRRWVVDRKDWDR